jgi:SHS family sialic acid transporter-like MFS transporter
MSAAQRYLVLVAVFLALVFDGVELGLMPVASLSVSKSLLGAGFTAELGGEWFARFTAALMLGAAIGGIALGSFGDRVGRTRAMGVCILVYSLFAAMGAYAQTQEQMLALRFLVGLGVGGLWPNGIALVSEGWSSASRPLVSGAMMAGLNFGVLALSQVAHQWHITPDSWRWVFQFAGLPALLGVFVLLALPESPKWLASRGMAKSPVTPLRELFQPQLIRFTLVGILLSAIPMSGAWSASKWMIPWSDKVAGAAHGRLSYCLISLATVSITFTMFQLTAPLQASFHPIVCAQGFVATLFFGWLALYLPELFPTRVRATGSGLAYNSGRFGTAVGVLAAGYLFTALGGDYARVGAICASVYALGIFVIWWAPDTKTQELAD